ncbi:MAG: hypothetical protein FWD49_03875 [Firmicutes bacterium]|nr:hypothetical protein [Bacillota bacterium]
MAESKLIYRYIRNCPAVGRICITVGKTHGTAKHTHHTPYPRPPATDRWVGGGV